MDQNPHKYWAFSGLVESGGRPQSSMTIAGGNFHDFSAPLLTVLFE